MTAYFRADWNDWERKRYAILDQTDNNGQDDYITGYYGLQQDPATVYSLLLLIDLRDYLERAGAADPITRLAG